MNRTWLIIEKVIAILLLVWGIAALYTVTTTIANMFKLGYIASQHISYFQLFVGAHLNFFLAIAAIVGGFMLFFNDKFGWIVSVVSCALYVVTFFRSSQANAVSSTQPYNAFSKSYSLMALLFLIILVFLIQKPFLKKYNVTATNWIWIIVIVALLILDKLFLK